MEKLVKDYIIEMFNDIEGLGKEVDISPVWMECYGVLDFAIKKLFNGHNESLKNWWNTEMVPKFKKEML